MDYKNFDHHSFDHMSDDELKKHHEDSSLVAELSGYDHDHRYADKINREMQNRGMPVYKKTPKNRKGETSMISDELREALGLAPYKSLQEAVPMGNIKPKTPAEQNAEKEQQEQDAATGQSDDANQVPADAPNASSMPGKIMTSAGNKPQMPNQPATGVQTPAQANANPAQAVNKNAAGASQGQAGAKNTGMPGQPNTTSVIGSSTPPNGAQPNAAQNSNSMNQNQKTDQYGKPMNPGDDEEEPGTQMLQNSEDGPTDVQPETDKVEDSTSPAKPKKGGVTMMSTTRPMPAPKHPLMGAGMNSSSKPVGESKMLQKFIKEFVEPRELGLMAAEAGRGLESNPYPVGHPNHDEFNSAHADHAQFFEPHHDLEEKPEPHARIIGYVIKDNKGHIHGRKWIMNAHGEGKDEGSPKIYTDKDEAYDLAKRWTDDEAEQDLNFMDRITYTVGAALSDASFRFPA